MKSGILSVCILLSFVSLILGTKKEVKDLFPGIYDGEIWSGYLDTDIAGNILFYTFTPSQNKKETDPVLLWLNGGPGCKIY